MAAYLTFCQTGVNTVVTSRLFASGQRFPMPEQF